MDATRKSVAAITDDDADTIGLTVRRGRVACPVRGWVELEECLDCSGYRGFAEGRIERLVCQPDLARVSNVFPSETTS